jgi:hypothetical protein
VSKRTKQPKPSVVHDEPVSNAIEVIEDETVEDIVLETTDNTKRHKVGCTYARYPFVCNC